MPVNQRGGVTRSARKHGPIFFGGTFLRLLVGPHNRIFSAHEDLLCARSTFFKRRFQAVRKDVSGECAVCLNELKMTDTEYCKTCGQNLHVTCMQGWLKTKKTCPTCRTLWRRLSDLKTSTLDQLDPDGFEVYLQWLYGQQISDYPKADTAEDRIIRLLKAHILGSTVDDNDFLHAVRRKIVEVVTKTQSNMTYAPIEFAYNNTEGHVCYAGLCAIWNVSRVFLIDQMESFMKKSAPHGHSDVWGMMAAEGHIELEDNEGES